VSVFVVTLKTKLILNKFDYLISKGRPYVTRESNLCYTKEPKRSVTSTSSSQWFIAQVR